MINVCLKTKRVPKVTLFALGMFCRMQEKVDELQMELDSSKLDLEHAQLSAKENEAAARALRFARWL